MRLSIFTQFKKKWDQPLQIPGKLDNELDIRDVLFCKLFIAEYPAVVISLEALTLY